MSATAVTLKHEIPPKAAMLAHQVGRSQAWTTGFVLLSELWVIDVTIRLILAHGKGLSHG